MSYESQKPPVENPLAFVLMGGRVEAVEWEAALRRYYAAGLQRLAAESLTEPMAALADLEDCAWAAIARYNGGNMPTPEPGALNTEPNTEV